MKADASLANALETSGIEVHVAGDALKPFNIAEAIFEGNRIGRNI